MNNQAWHFVSKTVKGINSLMAYVSAMLIVACTLVLVYEVLTRYLFKISNDWVIELSIFMLISATFLAAAQTQRERGHVGIEVLDEVMSSKWNRWRYLLGDVLSMLFCAFVAYQSWLYWHEAWEGGWESSSSWAPKLWIPYMVMAIGMSLLTLQFLVQLVEQFLLKATDAEQIAASHQHPPTLGD